jgi:hypothetical protein
MTIPAISPGDRLDELLDLDEFCTPEGWTVVVELSVTMTSVGVAVEGARAAKY